MLYVIFSLLAIFELYFFAIQRSNLDISRAANIDPRVGRLMLPLWYNVGWLIKVAKYYILYLIYQNFGILVAVICLTIPLIISTFMPIKNKYFIPIFYKKINENDGLINSDESYALLSALEFAEAELHQEKDS